MRKLLALACITIGTTVPTTASMAQIADGSFETQAPGEIGGNPGYCYGNGGGGGAFECSNGNSPWFAATGGGYQVETNSAWPGTETPAGIVLRVYPRWRFGQSAIHGRCDRQFRPRLLGGGARQRGALFRKSALRGPAGRSYNF